MIVSDPYLALMHSGDTLSYRSVIMLLSLFLGSVELCRGEGSGDHLLPPRGFLDYETSYGYEARLRSILLSNAPDSRVLAFSLVKTGAEKVPEYAVWLLFVNNHYQVIVRQASKHVWFNKGDNKITYVEKRTVIDTDRAYEIWKHWEKMLKGVRQYQGDKLVLADGNSFYYASNRTGRMLAGESPRVGGGENVSKMSRLTRWMAEQAWGRRFDALSTN